MNYFIGKAKVYEFLNASSIEKKDLENLDLNKDDIIIFKTRNSQLIKQAIFQENFTYISCEAAKYLAEIGIKTLGFDYLSVEEYGSSKCETHINLLKKNILIIEGLDLSPVEQGEYEIIAMPLKN